jgi:integrase
MGRPRKHLVIKTHPSPKFRDKVRLVQHLRGAADDSWNAQFLIDGQWVPNKPASLSTRDWDEACENARDRYSGILAGAPVRTEKVKHPFGLYADRAVAKLHQQADDADKVAMGKGHNFRDRARRIDHDLTPKWGNTDIRILTEHKLNDWIADDYRVEDVEATVAKYGRQKRGEGRRIIYKRPGETTLGNLDFALKLVWDEAVADGIVDRRLRPVINKVKFGADTEPRAFIDEVGVQAVARVMTDQWVKTPNRHGTDLKRMLRAYVAVITSTGIRPGLEAKRVRLGDVMFVSQQGRPVIFIRVTKNQGKHPKPRSVVVFEGDGSFRIRQLLTGHIAWRRGQGASDTDYLFAWKDGSFPTFRAALDTALMEANALIDPMTGEKRVAYSFRHYFATLLIELGLSVPVIAAWLGTSSAMIEKHYNRFLTERNAHLLNGAKLAWHQFVRESPHPVEPWETDRDVAGQIGRQ